MKQGTVILEIERIVAGGYGLARTDDGIVFVRGALPGERVTARPAFKTGALRAHAIEILHAHPGRVDLPLPPGADLPLAYPAQLPIKEALVREALERVAKLDVEIRPIHPSPLELGYRTAAQYAVDENGALGAHAAGSNKIVALPADPLVAQPIAAAFEVLARAPLHGIREVSFRASMHEGRVLVGLHGERAQHAERVARRLDHKNVAGVVWAELDARGRFRGRARVLSGEDRLLEDFGGVLGSVTVQSFAQVNPAAAGALYREAASAAAAAGRAIDLYAGSGILGLHLVPRFDEVVAIEIDADAVKRGEADARRLGVATVRFHRGDARAVARYLPADLVAVDPPRAGIASEIVDVLARAAPREILYVSCAPVTWARDLARFASHGYRPVLVRPYDFYPYTHRVEVLSLLRKDD